MKKRLKWERTEEEMKEGTSTMRHLRVGGGEVVEEGLLISGRQRRQQASESFAWITARQLFQCFPYATEDVCFSQTGRRREVPLKNEWRGLSRGPLFDIRCGAVIEIGNSLRDSADIHDPIKSGAFEEREKERKRQKKRMRRDWECFCGVKR